jgi:hypothetical protein
LVTANKQGNLNITIRNPGSREHTAIAENREYPPNRMPRPAQVKAQPTGEKPAASGGGNDRIFIPHPEPLPPIPIGKLPSPATGNTGPQPATTKDVTVIRGTEKTRAIVPR